MPSSRGTGDRPCPQGAHSLVRRRQNVNRLQSIEVSALMEVYKSAPGITREEQVKACTCTRVSKLKSLEPRVMTVSEVRGTCYAMGHPGDRGEQGAPSHQKRQLLLGSVHGLGDNVAHSDFLGRQICIYNIQTFKCLRSF